MTGLIIPAQTLTTSSLVARTRASCSCRSTTPRRAAQAEQSIRQARPIPRGQGADERRVQEERRGLRERPPPVPLCAAGHVPDHQPDRDRQHARTVGVREEARPT